MDESGKIQRKSPVTKSLYTKSAIYDSTGAFAHQEEAIEKETVKQAATLLENLAKVFGRNLSIDISPNELFVTDEDGNRTAISLNHAVSMVEETRLILSSILDRKI